MNKIYTKIFATMLGSVALMGASFALAQTPETFTFSSDLTIGSTGQDVVELQNFLEAQGFLVIPVGIDKGYFGSLTRDALAKYQENAHIAPAFGYFGQITRKILNEGLKANGNDNPNSASNSGNSPAGSAKKGISFTVLNNKQDDKVFLNEEATQTLTWESDPSVQRVTIDLYKAGVFKRNIATNIKNTGSYDWKIPTISSKSQYTIVITDATDSSKTATTESFIIVPSVTSGSGGGSTVHPASGGTSGGSGSQGGGSSPTPSGSPSSFAPRPSGFAAIWDAFKGLFR